MYTLQLANFFQEKPIRCSFELDALDFDLPIDGYSVCCFSYCCHQITDRSDLRGWVIILVYGFVSIAVQWAWWQNGFCSWWWDLVASHMLVAVRKHTSGSRSRAGINLSQLTGWYLPQSSKMFTTSFPNSAAIWVQHFKCVSLQGMLYIQIIIQSLLTFGSHFREIPWRGSIRIKILTFIYKIFIWKETFSEIQIVLLKELWNISNVRGHFIFNS